MKTILLVEQRVVAIHLLTGSIHHSRVIIFEVVRADERSRSGLLPYLDIIAEILVVEGLLRSDPFTWLLDQHLKNQVLGFPLLLAEFIIKRVRLILPNCLVKGLLIFGGKRQGTVAQ